MTPERKSLIGFRSLEEMEPAAVRCWNRVRVALPASVPSDPDDPSVNLSTLMAILHGALSRAETAEKRLKHSEFHRTANRRSMRQRGKIIERLSSKIVRQREQLRGYTRPRADKHERAAEFHRSLRTGPVEE